MYDVRLVMYFVAGVGLWGGGGCVCQVGGVLCCLCGEEVVYDVRLMVYFVAGVGLWGGGAYV